jgi:hypothetical protein
MAIPAGYVRITLPFSGAAVPTGAANVLAFANPLDLDADDIQILWNGAIGTDPWAFMSQECQATEMLIKFGPDSTGPQETRAIATGGGTTDDAGGAQVSALIRKSTALGGRRGRGRMYLPAIPEVQVNQGGELVEGFRSALEADTITFFGALATNSLIPCVEHTDGGTPTAITGWAVPGTVATQRRRQRR